MLGMAILFLPFQFCTLDSWQRLGAWATRKKSPKRDLTVAAIILGIAYCVPIAIGLWAYGAVGDKIGGDQPLRFFLERNNIPTVLIGIVFAGFLAAIISTADELLNCCSYSWMIDLLGVEKPPSGSAEEIKFIASGRLYTGILGMAAALTSIGAIWLEKNISELAIAVFSAQVVFIIPVSIALFAESKADEFAVEAIWATIIGYLVSILCVIIGWNWHSQPLADGAPVIGFLVAFIVFIPRGLFFLHRLLRRTFRRFQCIIRRLGRN
jgi:Na+/proline symporter